MIFDLHQHQSSQLKTFKDPLISVCLYSSKPCFFTINISFELKNFFFSSVTTPLFIFIYKKKYLFSLSLFFLNSNVSIRSSKPGSVKKELIRTKPYIHDNCAEMNKT